MGNLKLPGAHRNVRSRSTGVVIYWQAWRGGPSIGQFRGDTLAEAERLESAAARKIAEAYARTLRPDTPKDLIVGLVVAYKGAPDGYQKLAPSTQGHWAPWLDIIREYFGTLPVSALKAKGMRREIIKWRNQYAATPRKADFGVQVLRRVLSWAVDNELADANPALGIGELYVSDRSAQIVEPAEMAAILALVSPPMARWIRMAAATGLRRGDLQRLQWSHLTDTSIELATAKSRGRKRIIVPLLPEAKAVIAECRDAERLRAQIVTEAGRTPVVPLHVMTTAQGKPWSKDGPTGMWVKACKLAQPRIEKHLHDLRGNFATLLMGHGISDEQIADILGWQCENVVAIRRRYVDRDRIARGIADRLAGL